MINNLISVIYNRGEAMANGVYVPVAELPAAPLDVRLTGLLPAFGISSSAAAADFAFAAFRMVWDSSWRNEVYAVDPRLTFDINEVVYGQSLTLSSTSLVIAVAGIGGDLRAACLDRWADLKTAFNAAKSAQEAAAAIISGYQRSFSRAGG